MRPLPQFAVAMTMALSLSVTSLWAQTIKPSKPSHPSRGLYEQKLRAQELHKHEIHTRKAAEKAAVMALEAARKAQGKKDYAARQVRTYVVRKGDTLGSIAMGNGLGASGAKRILKWNPGLSVSQLHVGQKIKLPVKNQTKKMKHEFAAAEKALYAARYQIERDRGEMAKLRKKQVALKREYELAREKLDAAAKASRRDSERLRQILGKRAKREAEFVRACDKEKQRARVLRDQLEKALAHVRKMSTAVATEKRAGLYGHLVRDHETSKRLGDQLSDLSKSKEAIRRQYDESRKRLELEMLKAISTSTNRAVSDQARAMKLYVGALAKTRHKQGSSAEALERVERLAREHAEQAERAALKQMEQAERVAREYAEKAEHAAHEHMEQAERAAREHMERAEKAAREHTEHAERAAREHMEQAEKAARAHAEQAERAAHEQMEQTVRQYEGLKHSRRAPHDNDRNRNQYDIAREHVDQVGLELAEISRQRELVLAELKRSMAEHRNRTKSLARRLKQTAAELKNHDEELQDLKSELGGITPKHPEWKELMMVTNKMHRERDRLARELDSAQLKFDDSKLQSVDQYDSLKTSAAELLRHRSELQKTLPTAWLKLRAAAKKMEKAKQGVPSPIVARGGHSANRTARRASSKSSNKGGAHSHPEILEVVDGLRQEIREIRDLVEKLRAEARSKKKRLH